MKLKINLKLIIFTALFLADYLFAQNTKVPMMGRDSLSGQIAGQVIDKKTGEPLQGVNIVVRNTSFGTASDYDGYFLIQKIPPGIYTLEASMVGYYQENLDGISVNTTPPVHITFELNVRIYRLKEVIVTPGYFSLMEIEPKSSSALGSADLQHFPQLGEDICRAVARLPGLSSNDFFNQNWKSILD